ncbi:rap guanine nucleotide exchange factor 3 isoform X2 [Lagenorhynchus albirostris]|uniref:rap guanine nucleotide exchange factor 3 isoform X2 n=1 Tax=Lagenorhynchus albirostris TaxID=27610 RepID=UPI0028F0E14F|nr:rap guanine nucleotide exchange factor 3 isoform X2 [Lagenorhynchus albirostris]
MGTEAQGGDGFPHRARLGLWNPELDLHPPGAWPSSPAPLGSQPHLQRSQSPSAVLPLQPQCPHPRRVSWPGESRWQVGLAVEDSSVLGAPPVGGLPDVVPEGTLFNMVLRRMHRSRSCSYQLLLEHQRPSCIQGLRWTPLANSEESLDFSVSLEQASTERVLRAGRQLHRHLLATCPNLIRDRKYHLRLHRQCCSGRELVDGVLALGLGVHSRSQAVGICQVLLDEGALCHVKHDWAFQDRDTQFYRFPGPEPEPAGLHELEEELVEALALLSQRGPDALLTVALRKPPGQRTDEELDLIFEELLHIKAVAHLSNSVKRELAAVLLFEPHSKAGTVLFSQGDKGTSWYIIWKGSVNVVTHGKGLVTTVHEGDDFGQLALVNDAPRAATIILREDNCHFLRVDKQDFNRIIKDVEAKTMRLEEHGKVVLVLERTSQGTGPSRPPTPGRNRDIPQRLPPDPQCLHAHCPALRCPPAPISFRPQGIRMACGVGRRNPSYRGCAEPSEVPASRQAQLVHTGSGRPAPPLPKVWWVVWLEVVVPLTGAHFPRGARGRQRAGVQHLYLQQETTDPAAGQPVGGPVRPHAPHRPCGHQLPPETVRPGEQGCPALQPAAGAVAREAATPQVGKWLWERISADEGSFSAKGEVQPLLSLLPLPAGPSPTGSPPRPGTCLFGSPARMNLSPAATVPSESGTKLSQPSSPVPYDICRPDHSVLTLQLPVTASVREVMAALAQEDGWTKGQVLVKVNSAGDTVGLQPDAHGVATSLGLNERLFVVNPQEVHKLTPHPEQLGPTVGSAEGLDLVSTKDLAGQLTDHDWSLFNSIHQVELIHYVLGPQPLRDVTTANLERFMRRFNELQYWVATELCLCPVPGLRAQLLRKFIKLAAHLKEQKNLNSFFAIMFGLSNSAISRLAQTWERLPHKVRKLYSALERLLDPSWNHRVYRLALTKLSPPLIPFMPLLLKDMTFIHEGNHTLVENLINFEKMRMMARAARMLHHCRSHSNVPLSPLRSRVSHLHEDSQAARISTCSEQSLSTRSPASTWAYVQQLKVIDNQRELSRLSRELEP